MDKKSAKELKTLPRRVAADQTLASGRKDLREMERDEIEALVRELEVHQIELEMQNEELRRNHLEKEEFLAHLAHKLRTPLTPLLLAAQIIRVNTSDADLVERARGVIEKQVAIMGRLIDHLVNTGRMPQGSLDQNEKVVAPREEVESGAPASSDSDR